MEFALQLLLFLSMLLLATVLFPLSQKLGLPDGLVLVISGFIGSELITSFGFDTGLRWHHFHELVFYLFIPILVFNSALHLNLAQLYKQLPAMLILAIPMMLLATLVSATVLFFGIGYPSYYSWLAALLTGVLLSSTDPSVIIDLFRRAGVSERILLLLEGESLFNDSLSVLLFGLLSAMLLTVGDSQSVAGFSVAFLIVFAGGLACGAVSLLLIYPLFRSLEGTFNRLLLMLLACYLSYLIAEVVLDVSGVMAVMVVGLGSAQWLREQMESEERNKLFQYWAFQGQLTHSVMFLLLGVTITMTMFTQQWLAMLLGIGAVVVARVAGLLLTLPVINLLPDGKLHKGEPMIMYLGGTRGAVTIALALSIPIELDAWFTIQSIAYAVVLFGLMVQAVSAPYLIKHLISGDK